MSVFLYNLTANIPLFCQLYDIFRAKSEVFLQSAVQPDGLDDAPKQQIDDEGEP